MAKRGNEGIGFFPINTDIVFNPKVKLVVGEFGPKAWTVLFLLYCKIYREKGYWIDWYDEDKKLMFAQDECKLEVNFINEVVAGCIKRAVFDAGLFNTFGVLTSDRIQENYFFATIKRKSVPFFRQFLLTSDFKEEKVDFLDIKGDFLCKKVGISTHKRREDKKREEKESAASSDSLFPQGVESYRNVPRTKIGIAKFIKERPDFPEPYVDLWNIFAGETGKPTVQKITDMRKKKIHARVRDPLFDFTSVLKHAKESAFIKKSTWFTFDWVVENESNYLKVIEGNYYDGNTEAPEPGTTQMVM